MHTFCCGPVPFTVLRHNRRSESENFIYCKCLAYCCHIYKASKYTRPEWPPAQTHECIVTRPTPMISNDDHCQLAKFQSVKTGKISRHIF